MLQNASMNPKSTAFAQDHSSSDPTRHLPTYEEATIQYSFRLPAYRSSYIRRFHPYARYATRYIGEYDMDNDDSDHTYDEVPLDLRALEEPIPIPPTITAGAYVSDNIGNNPTEEL
ncbi:hypothetical protein APHAL10511_000927 [Amanita phalloides]|nr:hypothetical protein APHAL10511_000927 [Amanita phalloides]